MWTYDVFIQSSIISCGFSYLTGLQNIYLSSSLQERLLDKLYCTWQSRCCRWYRIDILSQLCNGNCNSSRHFAVLAPTERVFDELRTIEKRGLQEMIIMQFFRPLQNMSISGAALDHLVWTSKFIVVAMVMKSVKLVTFQNWRLGELIIRPLLIRVILTEWATENGLIRRMSFEQRARSPACLPRFIFASRFLLAKFFRGQLWIRRWTRQKRLSLNADQVNQAQGRSKQYDWVSTTKWKSFDLHLRETTKITSNRDLEDDDMLAPC